MMKNKKLGLILVAGLTPGITLAHGFGWNEGWAGHMGFMGGGFMMIFWILVLLIAVTAAFRFFGRGKNTPFAVNNAQVILAERYAKGEISLDEFKAIKKDLS
jgi:putative membrane protein